MPILGDSSGDPAFPTLAAVLDPAEVAKQFSLPWFAQWRWDTSQGIQHRVLQWRRASGCTFEVALKHSSGWQELIGKVYPEEWSDVFRAMEEIRQSGIDSEQEFAIPRPVAFLKPLRLLLYEKVPGTRAIKLIVDSNESGRVQAAEPRARWLAQFQALAPRSRQVFHLKDRLISLKRAWRGLADLGWPFASKASRLLEQLNTPALELGCIEMCAAHGAYTPAQVLLVNGSTITIDWHSHKVADPSHDVARFLVELKQLGLKFFGSVHAIDPVAKLILKTYLAAARSDVTTHLAFHKAAICLERAKNDVDKRAGVWRERGEAMLGEGLRVLEQEAIR